MVEVLKISGNCVCPVSHIGIGYHVRSAEAYFWAGYYANCVKFALMSRKSVPTLDTKPCWWCCHFHHCVVDRLTTKLNQTQMIH